LTVRLIVIFIRTFDIFAPRLGMIKNNFVKACQFIYASIP